MMPICYNYCDMPDKQQAYGEFILPTEYSAMWEY